MVRGRRPSKKVPSVNSTNESEEDPQPLECVAAIVLKEGAVLVEKRKLTKKVVPGAVAFPGGHVESGEGIEEALRRELMEELAITPFELR